MRKEQIFPAVLILLSVGAGLTYLLAGERMRAGYWFCAAGINFFATF